MNQNESNTLLDKQSTDKPSLGIQPSQQSKSEREKSRGGVLNSEAALGNSTSNHRKGLRRQWISSIIASLSYFILGTALGWPSPVLHNTRMSHEPVELSSLDATLMVTLFYAANALMPIPSGLLSDWVGRKASMLYLTILPLASWIFTWVANPKVMIHIARFFIGMYSGLALTVLPMYLGEIAEPKVRGKLASILQLFTNSGLVFSYVVGMCVSYGTFAIILGVLPLVHFLLLFLIPESPYWLIIKGKDQEASKRLAWLRGGNVESEDVENELGDIKRLIASDLIKPRSFKMLFTTKSYRKAMIIVETMSACQRLSGLSALMPYISITVPEMPEYGLKPNICAIITGLSNILGVIIALPLVDKLGRIPLLIASSLGCGVAMLLAAIWYYIHRQDVQDASWKWVPLTLFCIFGISMNVGLGPIPALLQGELFPSHLKGRASAITVMVLAASSVVINLTYIPIAESAGYWCDFSIYTMVCVAGSVFSCTYAFETKGKTLLEIQNRLTQ